MLKKPELLAPAGSLKHLQMALDFGADAVYAGVPKWSLRVRGNGFVHDDFEKGIAYAHKQGKKVHAVLNIIPHVRRTQGFNAILDEMAALKPDAFIMGDPGLIDMVRERYPEIPIHLSVQANTVNAGSVKFWHKVGLTRCILARELSITEIDLIKQACPEMEIEVFIHGALCIAVSGRCLISGFLAHRDANIGACNNACRYGFKVRNIHSAHSAEFADPESLSMQIEESMHHPNEWFNLEEDQCGSYLMNSKDLCALPILDKLIKTGVDSLKIEGRSRSPFYAAAISRAYRLAIDAIARNEDIPSESYQIVNSIPSRGYTTGLLVPHRPDETQDYNTNAPSAGKWQIAGDITGRDEEGRLLITVKNRFEKGSKMKLFTPHGLLDLSCEHMVDDRDRPVDVAPGSGYFVKVPYASELDLNTTVLLRDDS